MNQTTEIEQAQKLIAILRNQRSQVTSQLQEVDAQLQLTLAELQLAQQRLAQYEAADKKAETVVEPKTD